MDGVTLSYWFIRVLRTLLDSKNQIYSYMHLKHELQGLPPS